MKKRVIISECSYDFWVEVMAKLAREAEWEPVYWIGVPELRKPVTKAFPDIVFQSSLEAIRGIPAKEYEDLRGGALDQPFYERHAWHESIILTMMDRMDPGDVFSHGERVRLYDTLLRYWSAVIDRARPDLVLFSMAPHFVYDYVLYILCKERGIRTLMLDPIYVEGLVYVLDDYEAGSVAIRSTYERLCASEEPVSFTLTAENERHLARLSGTYAEAMPFYLKEKIDEITEWRESRLVATLRPIVRKLGDLPRYPRYAVSAMTRLRQLVSPAAPPRQYLKQKGTSIARSWMSGWDARRYRMAANRKKAYLARYYTRLTREPELDRPYVFVALHYQPERTTSPGGGAFCDQVRMVDLIAKAVPAGWTVYVKEHPGQLAPFWKGEQCRTTQFYDEIAAMPNVRLVPLSSPPFPLIDHARAVATISGTIGWESLIRGKPVLTFGDSWYSPCEGVFSTPSLHACRDAIAKIEAGFKVDHAKVRLFVHVLETQCFRGYIDHDNQKVAGVSHADNVVALATALRAFTEKRS